MSRSLLVLLLALLTACTRTENAAPPPAAASPSFDASRAQGNARLAAQDWEGAVDSYRRALDQRPDELDVRYRLAVALANLDRTAEAQVEFRWVVAHGPEGLEEVRIARQWLSALTPAPPRAAGKDGAPPDDKSGGRVEGRTEWSALEPGRARLRVQIQLVADDGSPQGRRRYGATFRLGDPYRFAGVTPGSYRLRARVGDTLLWDTSVTVEEGRPTVLNLTPASSVAPPDALRLQPARRS